MKLGPLLQAALDRHSVVSFEHSAEARNRPRRFWVVELDREGAMTVVQAPGGYDSPEAARAAHFEAAAQYLLIQDAFWTTVARAEDELMAVGTHYLAADGTLKVKP